MDVKIACKCVQGTEGACESECVGACIKCKVAIVCVTTIFRKTSRESHVGMERKGKESERDVL